MLRGRIGNTTSRPFIEGQLSIQSIGVESEKVSFLADTGADVGLLAPVDSTRLGVDYARCTPNPEPVAGVGGETRDTYLETAVLAFSDEDGLTTYGYVVEVLIFPQKKETEKLVSVVGRDILSRWRMDYWPSADSVTFEVEGWDYIVTYDPRGDAVSARSLLE